MHIEKIPDPTFSAFACMSLVSLKLKHLVGEVKGLVGKIDFEFYIDKDDGGMTRE